MWPFYKGTWATRGGRARVDKTSAGVFPYPALQDDNLDTMTAIWHTPRHDDCVPIYARSFASIATYDLDYETGWPLLSAAGWKPYGHLENSLVSPDGRTLAIHQNGQWQLATRYGCLNFDPGAPRQVESQVLQVAPSSEFTFPSTLVVPVVVGGLAATGRDMRCKRVFPAPNRSPLVLDGLGIAPEFRVCRSEFHGNVKCYAELNFGAPRYTASREPRRAMYLVDHRYDACRGCAGWYDVGRAAMRLLGSIYESGFYPSDQARRADLIRIGAFHLLPNTGRPYAHMYLPGAAKIELLVLEYSPYVIRIAPPDTAAAVILNHDHLPDADVDCMWSCGRAQP